MGSLSAVAIAKISSCVNNHSADSADFLNNFNLKDIWQNTLSEFTGKNLPTIVYCKKQKKHLWAQEAIWKRECMPLSNRWKKIKKITSIMFHILSSCWVCWPLDPPLLQRIFFFQEILIFSFVNIILDVVVSWKIK